MRKSKLVGLTPSLLIVQILCPFSMFLLLSVLGTMNLWFYESIMHCCFLRLEYCSPVPLSNPSRCTRSGLTFHLLEALPTLLASLGCVPRLACALL